jgi:acetyltransferase-like isoleucine patch superfamily enzyme
MKLKEFIIRNKSLSLSIIKLVDSLLFLIGYNKFKNKGSKNQITNKGSLFCSIKIKIKGSHNIITFGEFTKFSNTRIDIIGNNNQIHFDENITIKDSEFWAEDDNNKIYLGKHTRMHGCHLAATEGKTIHIGNDCLFSKNIDIRTGDSHSILRNITNERINPASSITIGEHVWIGKGVTILKGVTIGSNSIVGSNSLVLKGVPENTLVAGNPSRVIKENVTWVLERI